MTMHDIALKVSGPFIRTASGSVTAGIAICVDGWCFPETEWRDFVVVLGEWWAKAMYDLGEHGEAVLTFMDGPFEVMLRASDDGLVVAEFLSRTSTGTTSEKTLALPHDDLVATFAGGFAAAADMLKDAAFFPEAQQMLVFAGRVRGREVR